MSEPKPTQIPIFWAIAFLSLIFVTPILLITLDRPKASERTAPTPSTQAKFISKADAAATRKREIQREADRKCFEAVYNYERELRFEAKRKRLMITSRIPGTNRYIAKFQFTNKLGFRSVVECTIEDPMAVNSKPQIIVY